MKKLFSVLLILGSACLHAEIHQFKAGDIYNGKEWKYKNGHGYFPDDAEPTGKSCSIQVIKVTPKPERGVHCTDITIQPSQHKNPVTILGSASVTGYGSCAGSLLVGDEYWNRHVANDPNNFKETFIDYYSSKYSHASNSYKASLWVKRNGLLDHFKIQLPNRFPGDDLLNDRTRWCVLNP